ncbi:MAG: nucleoside monophosphate kinase [Minisyncoccia bacterium]
MKEFYNKKAVIIYGSPGSGKSTQAELLAKKFSFYHFDTGNYLRMLFANPVYKNNKEIQKEKQINESGRLNTPSFVLKIVKKATIHLAKNNSNIVFSGSPRTLFEAFGDSKHKGLMEILEKFYGKENIYVIFLNVNAQEAIKRNTSRLSCKFCDLSILGNSTITTCPFCGFQLTRRKDDNANTMAIRLKEYKERTYPILNLLQKNKFHIYKINGLLKPYQISEKISKILKLNK